MSMKSEEAASSNLDQELVDVVYLTNATGDVTGYGTLEVTDEDLTKIPFESGPGLVLPYLTEISGAKYLQGNLEVAFRDEFWGDDGKDFDSENSVRIYCEAIRDFVRPRLELGARLLPLDEGDPGRLVVQVAIPLESVSDRADAYSKLNSIFSTLSELPDQADFPPCADIEGAKLFFRELLASTGALSAVDDAHGTGTLADLMHLQQAILTGGTIEVWPEETAVCKVLEALPSAQRWLKYTDLPSEWKEHCDRVPCVTADAESDD